MSATANKQALTTAFDALAQGDGRPFVALMDDDFSWTATGEGVWAGTWTGKQTVREQLFGPLFAQFEGTYTNRATNMVAEGDTVVVECRGSVKTKAGPRYDNQYCYICRFEDGRLKAIREYMDSALAERVLVRTA
ncbi:MAG TPA: nuclear transport factor 2 family protein [Caulobacter sp.]|nr:nuclear transport factor 2 family protein [Caulobacter sp.]